MNNDIMNFTSKLVWNGCVVSKREFECANRLVDGLSAKEIAKLMNISHRTVEKYIENLKYKLNCRNQKKLILIILKHLQVSQNENEIKNDLKTMISSINTFYCLLINLNLLAL